MDPVSPAPVKVYLQVQQTPKPDAHDPAAVPPKTRETLNVDFPTLILIMSIFWAKLYENSGAPWSGGLIHQVISLTAPRVEGSNPGRSFF